MKRKVLSFVMVAMLMLSVLPVSVFAGFHDTEGHWAQTEIGKWSKNGIIQGSDEGFRPNAPITRGEMAVILNRVMKYQVNEKNSFADLDNSWYTEAILKANTAKIILGSNNTVRPKDKITREEAVVMFARALGLKEKVLAKAIAFNDSDNISNWAKGYINALVDRGYIKGDPNGNFKPKSNITRAEVVKILDNSIKELYNKEGTYSDKVIEGNLVVNTPAVNLKNVEIKGNIIIAEGVGEGEVKLDNVKIGGDTIVKGGGVNSVCLNNVTVGGALIVNKVGGNLRIVVTGTTSASVATLESGAILVTKDLVGGGIEKVEIPADIAAGQNIVLMGNFKNVENNASNIAIQATGKIENLVLNKAATVTGGAEVKNITAAQGADSVVNNKTVKGGSSASATPIVPTAVPTPNATAANAINTGSSGGTNSGGNNSSQKFKVTFNTNGGSVINAVYVESAGIITLPANPFKAGNTFAGWYTNEGLTQAFNASTPISANITLYAKWSTNSAQTYTVTFITNGGSTINPITVNSEATITLPANPTKADVTFIGWYIDEALTSEFSVSTPVTSNITLYAKWSGWQEPVQIDSRFAVGYPKSSLNGSDIELKVKLVGASAEHPMEVFMVVNRANSHWPDIDSTAVIHGHAGSGDSMVYVDKAPYIKITDENEHTIPTEVNITGNDSVKIYFVVKDATTTSQTPTMVEYTGEATGGAMTGPDNYVPAVMSAYINNAKDQIILYFDKKLNTGSIPNADDFTLSGGSVSTDGTVVTSVSISDIEDVGEVKLSLNHPVNDISGLNISYNGNKLKDTATVPNVVGNISNREVEAAHLSVKNVYVSNNGQYITMEIDKCLLLIGASKLYNLTIKYGTSSATATTVSTEDYNLSRSWAYDGGYMDFCVRLNKAPVLTNGNKYFITLDPNGLTDYAGDSVPALNVEGIPAVTPEEGILPLSAVYNPTAKIITLKFDSSSGLVDSFLYCCFIKLSVDGKEYVLRGDGCLYEGRFTISQYNIPFDMAAVNWANAKISYSPDIHPKAPEWRYLKFKSGLPYAGFSNFQITQQ